MQCMCWWFGVWWLVCSCCFVECVGESSCAFQVVSWFLCWIACLFGLFCFVVVFRVVPMFPDHFGVSMFGETMYGPEFVLPNQPFRNNQLCESSSHILQTRSAPIFFPAPPSLVLMSQRCLQLFIMHLFHHVAILRPHCSVLSCNKFAV